MHRANTDSLGIPRQLCSHSGPLSIRRGYRAECPVCYSYWDVDAFSSGLEYDASYPALRSHYDPRIGENKVKTIRLWLERLGIDTVGLTVCEVGFGGGHCLKFLYEQSQRAFGIEAIEENIDHAAALGVAKENIFSADALPDKLPSQVDLWIFCDSFEHLPDPNTFVHWVARNSAVNSRMLLVAPEAGSLSDMLLGRFWPHKMNDHRFHWSRKGLVQFLGERNFTLSAEFKPVKYLAATTVIAHILQKIGAPRWLSQRADLQILSDIGLRFNLGEMGLLFRIGHGHQ